MRIPVSCLFWASLCVVGGSVPVYNGTRPLRISFLASRKFYSGLLYGGAFYRAVDDVNKDRSLLPGYVLEPMFADTHSDILETVELMTTHKTNGTLGFIGPEGACGIAATNAAAWNMPMVVYVSIFCLTNEITQSPTTHYTRPLYEFIISSNLCRQNKSLLWNFCDNFSHCCEN